MSLDKHLDDFQCREGGRQFEEKKPANTLQCALVYHFPSNGLQLVTTDGMKVVTAFPSDGKGWRCPGCGITCGAVEVANHCTKEFGAGQVLFTESVVNLIAQGGPANKPAPARAAHDDWEHPQAANASGRHPLDDPDKPGKYFGRVEPPMDEEERKKIESILDEAKKMRAKADAMEHEARVFYLNRLKSTVQALELYFGERYEVKKIDGDRKDGAAMWGT